MKKRHKEASVTSKNVVVTLTHKSELQTKLLISMEVVNTSPTLPCTTHPLEVQRNMWSNNHLFRSIREILGMKTSLNIGLNLVFTLSWVFGQVLYHLVSFSICLKIILKNSSSFTNHRGRGLVSIT